MLAVARIRLLTLACVLTTAVAIGGISFAGFGDLVRQQRAEHVQSAVGRNARALELALAELWNDVRLIAALPSVQVVAVGKRASPGVNAAADRVAAIFERMLLAKSAYVQLRFIGVDGKEVVRVDRVEGGFVRVGADNLQSKAQRDYYLETLAAGPGEVHASPITLNREQGRVEVPHRPMLRAAMTITDVAGKPRGIVVINLELERLLSALDIGSDDRQSTYITNGAGDFLLHPDADKRFGFDLGARWRGQDEYAELEPIVAGAREARWEVDDDVAYFQRAYPFPDEGRFLIVGQRASVESLAFGSVALVRQAALTIGLLVLALVVVSIWIGRVQTRPLERMTRAVRALGRREAFEDLPVQRHDEFGVLARAFTTMTQDLERHERELRALNEGLADANEDLEHFVHIAAHDLREPLRKLLKVVDLLEDEVDPQFEGLLGDVRSCTAQMLAMIDDFRALTRVGSTDLVRAEVDLEGLLDDVVAELGERIEQRSVRVERDPLPTIDAYAGLLHQLYINLVTNALDHARGDGFTLRMTATQIGSTWRLGVFNSGSTISEDARQEVFKLFRKGHADSSQGTGVGLSLCKKIVERHRGRIWIEATPSHFHVQFELEGHEHQAG